MSDISDQMMDGMRHVPLAIPDECIIKDNEPIRCLFQKLVNGEWETYCTVGAFPFTELKARLVRLCE